MNCNYGTSLLWIREKLRNQHSPNHFYSTRFTTLMTSFHISFIQLDTNLYSFYELWLSWPMLSLSSDHSIYVKEFEHNKKASVLLILLKKPHNKKAIHTNCLIRPHKYTQQSADQGLMYSGPSEKHQTLWLVSQYYIIATYMILLTFLHRSLFIIAAYCPTVGLFSCSAQHQ
jgi:hypothetical protein